MRTPKNQSPLRAIILIVSVFALVVFVRSESVHSFALTMAPSPVRSFSLLYTERASSVKSRFLKAQTINITKTGAPKENNLASREAMIPFRPRFVAPQPPYSIILVGDSFIAERFGPHLEKLLGGYASTTVHREGIYSTGLSRQDYFDWEEKIVTLIEERQPNIVIVMFGANDAQDAVRKDGTAVNYYGKDWDPEYGARIARFLQVMREGNRNRTVIWIGNPIPRGEKYRLKMERLNRLYKQETEKVPQAFFIDTWDALKNEEGIYSAFLPDENNIQKRARSSDGIHTTEFGAALLARYVVNAIIHKIPFEEFVLPKEIRGEASTSLPYSPESP